MKIKTYLNKYLLIGTLAFIVITACQYPKAVQRSKEQLVIDMQKDVEELYKFRDVKKMERDL